MAEPLAPPHLYHVATLQNYSTFMMENIYLFDNATESHLMDRCHAVESLPNTHFVFINSTQLRWVGTAGRPFDDD